MSRRCWASLRGDASGPDPGRSRLDWSLLPPPRTRALYRLVNARTVRIQNFWWDTFRRPPMLQRQGQAAAKRTREGLRLLGATTLEAYVDALERCAGGEGRQIEGCIADRSAFLGPGMDKLTSAFTRVDLTGRIPQVGGTRAVAPGASPVQACSASRRMRARRMPPSIASAAGSVRREAVLAGM